MSEGKMIKRGSMKPTGIKRRSEWEMEICPYCWQELHKIQVMKRKTLKKCVCGKCKKTIDERHRVW